MDRRSIDDSGMVEIVFTVRKDTNPGEQISIVGSLEELWSWRPGHHGVLQTRPGEYPMWSRMIRLPRSQVRGGKVEYKFVLLKTDGQIEWEGGPNRILPSMMCESDARLPFAKFGRIEPTVSFPPALTPASSRQPCEGTSEVCFRVKYKFTELNDTVVIVGSADKLGNWQPANGLLLTTSEKLFPTWTAITRLPSGMSVQWKIVIKRACGRVDWEDIPDRNFDKEENVGGWVVEAAFNGEMILKPQAGRNGDEPKRAADERKTCNSPTMISPLVAAQRRCTSMSTITACNLNGVDSPAREDLSLETGPIRRNVSAPPPREQLVILNLADVAIDKWKAESFKVEVVFEGCDVRQTLAFENEKGCWALHAHRLHLPDGLHVFHFLICGVRIVSSAHPVSGDSNLAIFSDSIRRYLAVRDGSGVAIDEIEAVRKMSSSGSVGARTYSPRTGENTRLQKGRLLAPGERAGGMVRPLSHAGNLSQMIDNDSDEEQEIHIPSRELARTPFEFAKFDGLFDRDLRWRLDRVLPQLPEPSLNGQHRRHVRLWPGAKRIGKQIGMCEDAYFCEQYGAGIADGVGQFVHYKDCNAAEYAKELMDHAREFLQLERSAAEACKAGYLPCVCGNISLASCRFCNKCGAKLPELEEHMQDTSSAETKETVCMCGHAFSEDFCKFCRKCGAKRPEPMDKPVLASSETSSEPVQEQATSIAKRRAQAAMAAADERSQEYGGSTILVLVLEGHTVGVANLGDSGFMLLRRAQGGMKVVECSAEQQHKWNQPYQLMRLPPSLAAKYPKYKEKADKASDCEGYAVDVQEGDLLLLFTDGLSDNLYRNEILDIVDCALAPQFAELLGVPAEVSTSPDSIANALATAAQEKSLSESAKVPFNENAKKEMSFDFKGGKQDDITVVAAWVMPEQNEAVSNSRHILQAEMLQAAVEKSKPPPPVQAIEKTILEADDDEEEACDIGDPFEMMGGMGAEEVYKVTLLSEDAVEKIKPAPPVQAIDKTSFEVDNEEKEADSEFYIRAKQRPVDVGLDSSLHNALAEIAEACHQANVAPDAKTKIVCEYLTTPNISPNISRESSEIMFEPVQLSSTVHSSVRPEQRVFETKSRMDAQSLSKTEFRPVPRPQPNRSVAKQSRKR